MPLILWDISSFFQINASKMGWAVNMNYENICLSIVNILMAVAFNIFILEKCLCGKSFLELDFKACTGIEKVPSTRVSLFKHVLFDSLFYL